MLFVLSLFHSFLDEFVAGNTVNPVCCYAACVLVMLPAETKPRNMFAHAVQKNVQLPLSSTGCKKLGKMYIVFEALGWTFFQFGRLQDTL